MFTHVATTMLLTAGLMMAGTGNAATKPFCCIKNAYCCQAERPCCSKTGTAEPAVNHSATTENHSMARASCCQKRPYCCSVKRACCNDGVSTSQTN